MLMQSAFAGQLNLLVLHSSKSDMKKNKKKRQYEKVGSFLCAFSATRVNLNYINVLSTLVVGAVNWCPY